MSEITLNQKSWLTHKLFELLDYKYDTEDIGEQIDVMESNRYKYIVSLMYKQDKDMIKMELGLE